MVELLLRRDLKIWPREQRELYKYEGTIPKPSNYDDKSIVDQEKWNSMTGLEKKTPVIQRPKPFVNEDLVLTL